MTTLTFSDAYDLVSKKILINKIAIDNINTQIQYCIADQKRHDIIIDVCKQKNTLLVELNTILELQLKSFDEFRQNQCLEIYKEMNALDEPVNEYIEYSKECRNAEHKLNDGVLRINAIEATIPDTMCVTNYKIAVSSVEDTIKVLDEMSV
jgi:hypothetical protein